MTAVFPTVAPAARSPEHDSQKLQGANFHLDDEPVQRLPHKVEQQGRSQHERPRGGLLRLAGSSGAVGWPAQHAGGTGSCSLHPGGARKVFVSPQRQAGQQMNEHAAAGQQASVSSGSTGYQVQHCQR